MYNGESYGPWWPWDHSNKADFTVCRAKGISLTNGTWMAYDSALKVDILRTPTKDPFPLEKFTKLLWFQPLHPDNRGTIRVRSAGTGPASAVGTLCLPHLRIPRP